MRSKTVCRCLAAATATATWIFVHGVAGASPSTISADSFEVLCTPTDPGLEELSGLVWSGPDIGYAIGDRGTDDRLAVLDRQCRVVQWIEIDADTVDVEDLAQDATGVLWLSDTGDNDADRSSIALIGVNPVSSRQHRLPVAFTDGAHDVEAFALTPAGAPVLVTKVQDGPADVYTTLEGETVHTMSTQDPTPLVRVGAVAASSDDDKVRPITGAAVSVDGTTAALRTKKEVFIYRVAEGDVAGAFTSMPSAVITAPDQPQGEAVAFTSDGDLLLASEADGRTIPPVLRASLDRALGQAEDEHIDGLRVPVSMTVVGALALAFGAGTAMWWAYRRRRDCT